MATKAEQEGLNAALTAAIAADPALKADMRKIAAAILARTKYVINYGSNAQVDALVKAAMPGMLRALSGIQSTEAEEGERAAYERVLLQREPMTLADKKFSGHREARARRDTCWTTPTL